jgi:hypothetical protein
MESRTANLVLRLLQRHLPVPLPAAKHGQSHLPGLLPRVPLSFRAPAAAEKRLLDSAVSRHGGPPESGVSFADVERTSFGVFFKQPSSPFLSFDRASDTARAPLKGKVAGARGLGVEAPEPVGGFRLGLRLKSGMYMPARHEEEGWVASSVKRKRKKKMNKHKQRKLRRRDRHRN